MPPRASQRQRDELHGHGRNRNAEARHRARRTPALVATGARATHDSPECPDREDATGLEGPLGLATAEGPQRRHTRASDLALPPDREMIRSVPLRKLDHASPCASPPCSAHAQHGSTGHRRARQATCPCGACCACGVAGLWADRAHTLCTNLNLEAHRCSWRTTAPARLRLRLRPHLRRAPRWRARTSTHPAPNTVTTRLPGRQGQARPAARLRAAAGLRRRLGRRLSAPRPPPLGA
jgi:hypothetical protein